jgi:hypothetical protein
MGVVNAVPFKSIMIAIGEFLARRAVGNCYARARLASTGRSVSATLPSPIVMVILLGSYYTTSLAYVPQSSS